MPDIELVKEIMALLSAGISLFFAIKSMIEWRKKDEASAIYAMTWAILAAVGAQ